MFLFKRSNGFYYIYFEVDGKRKAQSTGCKKKTEALQYLNRISSKLYQEKELKYIPISLNKFFWEFLKHSEVIHTDKTLKSFKVTFKKFESFIGNPQIKDISEKQIFQYVDYRTSNPSVYQARKDIINLSSCFSWGIQQKYLITNPCKNVKRPKPPEKQPKFYTQMEFEKLLSVVDNEEFKALLILAVNTGLRQMELLELRWYQINFKDRILLLDNQKHITKGKKIRSIPLNQSALEALHKLKGMNFQNYVFSFVKITNRWKYVQNNMRKFIKEAKINPVLNFHALRATFASWMVQKGVPIYQVSKLLGHSDLRMTQVYAFLRQDDLFKAVNILSEKK
jgi:integrase